MKKMDFKVVKEGHVVSIVRVKSMEQRDRTQSTQRMRVFCFDSAQIDRIFHIQEKSVNSSHR